MNPEQQFARQICNALDAGVRDLDPAILERLRAARERALQRQSQAAGAPAILGAGGTASLLADGGREGHPWRTLIAILTLVAGMGLAYYWNSFEQADANEEVDSALLADDLPPKAYLDPGFQAWITHYVQSEQSAH